MYKIFHNPRCKKSREALDLLKNSFVEYEVILYIQNHLSTFEIIDLLRQLKVYPKELVRKQEKIWKDNFKNNTLSEDHYIKILVTHPKLNQRPIIFIKTKQLLEDQLIL